MRNIIYYVFVVAVIFAFMGTTLSLLDNAYARIDTVCQEGC